VNETEVAARFESVKADGNMIELLELAGLLFAGVAVKLNRIVPDGGEKILMLTHLEEAGMWASKAISRG